MIGLTNNRTCAMKTENPQGLIVRARLCRNPLRMKKTRHRTCAVRSGVYIGCLHLDSRLLNRLRRPVGRFDAELLGVLGAQSLPTFEPHRLATNHAADGSSVEKAI